MLFVIATVHAIAAPQCTLQQGIQYIGNDVAPAKWSLSHAACCHSCAKNPYGECVFFTFESAKIGGRCHHKGTNAPDHSRHNASCVSGYIGVDPPAPPAKPDYSLRIGKRLSTTGEHYVCWNIDASANRGFFWRNLSAAAPFGARIAKQASALGRSQSGNFSIVRFGGSGNDYLYYEFGGYKCPPTSEYKQCLNQTMWTDLLSFTAASSARMILGLSLQTGEDVDGGPFPYPWDPSNARHLLEWTIKNGYAHLIHGFELGNEQNTQYTAEQMAHNVQTLHNLSVSLWPDASNRPKLFGPDPHSLHDATSDASKAELKWITDWLKACKSKGVPIHGATHHEYVEVSPTPTGFTSPPRLTLNRGIADAVVDAVRSVDKSVGVWGGEIGPHNGGSPVCDHSSMRWAVFGDVLWFADALGAKAAAGYAGFCRQDLIGADYGLLDCATGVPLPDYYIALAFAQLMGRGALAASVEEHSEQKKDESAIRVYAHCSKGDVNGSVTALVINLAKESTNINFESPVTQEYVLSADTAANASLTGVGGLLGTGILLNGKRLAPLDDGTVLPLQPHVLGSKVARVPAESVAFFVMPEAMNDECV